MSKPSPRRQPAGWVVDLRDLSRSPGSMTAMTVGLASPERLGTDMVAVPAGGSIALDLRLESVSEGVLVSGTATAEATGECVRCLRDLTVPLSAPVHELFAYQGSATEETTDSDEVRRIEHEHIDLLPLIRDILVLDLPLNPVCKDQCRGLCPGCGLPLEDLPDDHGHDVIDPRWQKLQALQAQQQAEQQGRA